MNYKGIIIEESLRDKSVLNDIRLLETKVEEVTENHKTPWVKQWTLHTVEVPEEKADHIAHRISQSIDDRHQSSWYADYKNDKIHYIIFKDKIFKVDLTNPILYKDAKNFGISKGIPEHQVDFDPEVQAWKR